MKIFKKYSINKIPIVELPSSDTLCIYEHHFVADIPGEKYYLQANLHGPETVGIGVLLQLVDSIKRNGLASGEVKIVISANPIGLNSKISGYQVGYKNLNITKYNNWNKIFKQKLPNNNSTHGTAIEDKLASALQKISVNFDTYIDLHSAQNNIEVAYAFPNTVEFAKNLDLKHIVTLEDTFTGCFDEASYFASNKEAKVLTLELHGGTFDQIYIQKWSNNIFNLISRNGVSINSPTIWQYKNDVKYYSHTSGLVVPTFQPGSHFNKNDSIVELWSINGSKSAINASAPGVIYKLPITQSVGEGEEVIEVFQEEI